MSDHIPLEIQMEIMKRFPVKSLFQFRTVSKTWKSIIDSSQFITDYEKCTTRPQHLLIRYKPDQIDSDPKYICIIDDDHFPQYKYLSTGPFNFGKEFIIHHLIGSSSGLVCFYAMYTKPDAETPYRNVDMAVIWNPSTRKSIAVYVPLMFEYHCNNLCFAVCPKTSDLMLVKINDPEVPWQVDVFKLSEGVWRRPLGNNPRKSIEFTWSRVSLDGFMYWHATDKIDMEGQSSYYNLIMLFDMESEVFTEVNLPRDLASSGSDLSISKSGESLFVLQQDKKAEKPVCGVWVMNHGDSISFKKLFNISAPYASTEAVLGFRKNGEPIMEKKIEGDKNLTELEVYDPCSEQVKALGICGEYGYRLSFVSSYMESLLLLDGLDGNIYCHKWS